MTRILTIISLLFATPAWAMSSEQIIFEGEILASSGSDSGTDLVGEQGFFCITRGPNQ